MTKDEQNKIMATRVGDAYGRLREQKEHGILDRRGYHDHLNIAEPNGCIGYLGGFKVTSLWRGWARFKQNRS